MLLFKVDIGLHEMGIDDFTYIESFRYWDLRKSMDTTPSTLQIRKLRSWKGSDFPKVTEQ